MKTEKIEHTKLDAILAGFSTFLIMVGAWSAWGFGVALFSFGVLLAISITVNDVLTRATRITRE